MPAWDNVTLPSGPTPASYAPPLLNMGWLGDLGKNYFEGTQMGRTRALQTAFQGPGGVPTNPDGTININAVTQKLGKLGGPEAIQPLMKYQMMQAIGKDAEGNIVDPQGTGAPTIPPHGVPAPRSTMTGPQVAAPEASTTTAQPQTLTDYVRAKFPDDDATAEKVIQVAKGSGVDEFTPIDPNSATGARVNRWIASAKGGTIPTGGTAGQPAPQTFAQRADPAFSATGTGGPATAPPIPAGQPGYFSLENAQRYENAARVAAKGAARYGADPEFAGTSKSLTDVYNQNMAVAKQIREALAPTQAQKDAAASGIPGGNPLGYERAKEGQKADVAQFSKLYEGISSTGDIAGSGLENLRLSRSLLNEPTFVSGFGTDIVQGYRKAIAQLSPGHENDAQPQETFRKVMAGSILQQINTLKAEGQAAGLTNSRFFQSQVMLMEKAAQNPSNSVAANRTLTEIAWRHSQLSIQIANMADQYKQTHGGLLDSGFSQLLRQKLSSTSIFTPAELAQPKLLAAVTMPALTEEQVPAWARAMKIQPGQPVRTQSGRYVVPIEVSRTKSGPLAAPAGAQY